MSASPKNQPGPILAGLLASGAAYIDGSTIVGVAADGVEVSLGTTDVTLSGASGYALAETYLTDYPTPEMW